LGSGSWIRYLKQCSQGRGLPACMRSFILIHPTVRPQHTSVTHKIDRTDRQTTVPYSIRRTVLQKVAQKLAFYTFYIRLTLDRPLQRIALTHSSVPEVFGLVRTYRGKVLASWAQYAAAISAFSLWRCY